MRGMTESLTIGERVAFYRRRRGLSQEVVAGLVGRTEDWLSKIENNRAELDRLSVIRKLRRRPRRLPGRPARRADLPGLDRRQRHRHRHRRCARR